MCNGPKYVGDGTTCTQCKELKAKKAERSAKAHAKRVDKVYGITAEEYAEILAAQGGGCAICPRKPGKKRLAVDHDHDYEAQLLREGVEETLARRWSVRGLLCRNCNFHVVGGLKNDPEAFRRGARYIESPPAHQILRGAA